MLFLIFFQPISIISPIVQTNRQNQRTTRLPLMAFNTSLTVPNQESVDKARIFRNQSFHGFQTKIQNVAPLFLTKSNIAPQTGVKQFSHQNLQNINFSSPLCHPPYDFLASNGSIHTTSSAGLNQSRRQLLVSSNSRSSERVVGRNEAKLDIRRTASGINTYDNKSETSARSHTIVQNRQSTQRTKNRKTCENKRCSSLTLRNHRCYSPTFYSVRCKKHAKRRPIIYTILKSSKILNNQKTSAPVSNKPNEYENLSDSIQFCEQNAENSENEKRKTPKPAPRCKKHKKEIIYQNIANILSQNLNSSNDSSINEPQVAVTEALVHTDSTNNVAPTKEIPNTKPEIQKMIPKSPTANLKLTPTVKISPNFIKPLTESPKGALNTQLQARLKNLNSPLSNVSTQTTSKESPLDGDVKVAIPINSNSNSSLVSSRSTVPKLNAIKPSRRQEIVKPLRSIRRMPLKNAESNDDKKTDLIGSNQVCFNFAFFFLRNYSPWYPHKINFKSVSVFLVNYLDSVK